MEQPKSPSDGQSGVASPALPPWMHRTTPSAPDRRARMLEHMARARSLPQRQAATAPEPSRVRGKDVLGDAYGYTVLFGLMALLFMSRVPLYLGAFLFFADGERIERALAAIGIRLEPGAVGPDIIKNFAYLFGWLALLISLKDTVPAWLVPWIPPAESWSFLAGIALALAVVEAFATRALLRALPWLGFEIGAESPAWTTIRFFVAVALLACLVLLGSL
ncbi:hypothetical protein XI09_17020 [Bradyrhizobium sp. CCBAU 11386]|uniref:hypothetical protein n=1 Tax=Bradyrhizobium sp. CCBAU 11386 TaxID=1630837 RepID=UPI002303BE2D|nr:hypothetical protein [Bradyrhizobium sp. CCBAU 11386]MDA9506302.1 hypothetical protein [Bradyrhizobium sp. CCBAU 11386]